MLRHFYAAKLVRRTRFVPFYVFLRFKFLHHMKMLYGFLQLSILTICGLFIHNQLLSQIFISPAASGRANEATGFYYALPQNLLKIDFILEKNSRYKGPYAEFAVRILGVDNFVKQDETIYTIRDVVITKITEPDPNAWFFVEFDEKGSRDAQSLIFSLQPDGIIIAADNAEQSSTKTSMRIEKQIVNAPESGRFQYFAERNLYQRVDTIVRKITIDTTTIRHNVLQTSWVDRNPEQKAKSAADMIHTIREKRFNLISGYQEINYGQSLVYMNDQLNRLEQEYLALFLGSEIRSIEEQTVYFLPEAGKTGIQVFARFNENQGIVDTGSKGEALQIKIDPASSTQSLMGIATPSKSRLSNVMYFRIPEYVHAQVLFKGRILAKDRTAISQLGPIGIAPLSKTRLQFDPETGQVKTIRRE